MRLVTLLGALSIAPYALAQGPVLHVRARTAFRVDKVERTGSDQLLSGRLLDESVAAPLASRTVALREEGAANSPQWMQITDRDGRFTFHLTLPPGSHRVQLVATNGLFEFGAYDPPAPLVRELDNWLSGSSATSKSDRHSRLLDVAPSRPLETDLAYFFPPALTIWGAAFVTWRRRKRARARPLPSRHTLQVPRRSAPQVKEAPRADDFGVAGQVRDALTGRPVAAELRLTEGREARVVPLSKSGAFLCEGLPPGPVRLTVHSQEHLTYDRPLSLPHGGELRGLEIALLPIRAHLLERYVEWAKHHQVGDAHATVRELAAALCEQTRKPSATVAALTALVEEAYWGPRMGSRVMLEEAERLIAELDRT